MIFKKSNIESYKNYDNIDFSKVLLKELIIQRKKEWYKIFYIEWVFDRFHKWHETFFKYIRRKIENRFWDKVKIIVGVESDKVVKRKKWRNRPYDAEFLRLKNVENQEEVDFVFIVNRDIRDLIEDLKYLWIDYLIIPDEYFYNKLILKFFKKYILPKLKSNWIKVIFSRHKQYKKFGIDDRYVNLHTTDLLEKWWGKIFTKVRHIIYLIRESLIAVLNR